MAGTVRTQEGVGAATVNPTLFDYSETTTDWLQHLYRNLGIFQGELRAKVLASIVYELARRGIPVSG